MAYEHERISVSTLQTQAYHFLRGQVGLSMYFIQSTDEMGIDGLCKFVMIGTNKCTSVEQQNAH